MVIVRFYLVAFKNKLIPNQLPRVVWLFAAANLIKNRYIFVPEFEKSLTNENYYD